MHIDDPNFARRKILGNNGSQVHSPKKRWDEGTFGNERQLLLDHVQTTLKQQQKDADILEQFRKQAQQYKARKRREKFPHLFANQPKSQAEQSLKQSFVIKNQTYLSPQINLQSAYMKEQTANNRNQTQIPQQLFMPSPLYPPFQPFPNYLTELQSRVQYQRVIAQKDLELFKREEKIKRQKKEIKKLYNRLKEVQKQDELEKYLKSQEEMKRVNDMLMGIRQQLDQRNQLLNNHAQLTKANNHREQTLLARASPSFRQKRNRSQFLTNSIKKSSLISMHKDSDPPQYYSQDQSNPQIQYSPIIKKNTSSVFQNLPLYSNSLTKAKLNLGDQLDELRLYNQRLEVLHKKNSQKLKKIT